MALTYIRPGKAGPKDLEYIVDQTLASTFNGDAIVCEGFDRLIVEVKIASANNAVVTLAIQAAGTFGLWGNVSLDKITTSDTTAITLSSGLISVNDPAANASVIAIVTNPAPLMRLSCTSRTAGGANDLDAAYWLEAVR